MSEKLPKKSERAVESQLDACGLRNRISWLVKRQQDNMPIPGVPVQALSRELIQMNNAHATLDIGTAIVDENGRDIALPIASVSVCGENEIGEMVFADYVLAFDNHGNWSPRHSSVVFGVHDYNNKELASPRGEVEGWHSGMRMLAAHDFIASNGDGEFRETVEGLTDPSIDGDRLEQIAAIVGDIEHYFAH